MAAALQMVDGKTLYRDAWFDKPPVIAAFYLPSVRSRAGPCASRVLYMRCLSAGLPMASHATFGRLWKADGPPLWQAFF